MTLGYINFYLATSDKLINVTKQKETKMIRITFVSNSAKDLNEQIKKYVADLNPTTVSEDLEEVYNTPSVSNDYQPQEETVEVNEYDKTGVPFDSRIHAESRRLSGKGEWIRRRRLDEAYVKQVEAELELKKRTAQAIAAPMPTPPSVPDNVVVEPPPLAPIAVVAPAQPEVTTIPTPKVTTVGYVHNPLTFRNNLAMIVGQLLKEGKLTPDYVQTLNSHFKVQNIWDIAKDEALSNALFETFVQYDLVQRA